jgi:putative nucleotidyltransferase-like protein
MTSTAASHRRGVDQRTLTIDDILSVLLPSAAESALLGACLHSGDRARNEWARWRAGRGTDEERLCHDLAATRTLLPLLARSVASNGLDSGPRVLAYLRAATLREELRASRFRTIAAEAVDALNRDGVATLVVGGTALAATVYDAWSLRHCHDLDVLVAPEEIARAASVLTRVGCAPIGPRPHPLRGAVAEHRSGLRIALHTRPFAVPYYDGPVEWFASSDQCIAIDGVSARAASPEATLVHVLGHATYSTSRGNLRWVADLWHLLARHRDLDWTAIEANIEAHRLALPVSVLLRHLACFGLPVPPNALMRLRERAALAGRVAEDVALGGALAATRGDFRHLWRSTASWRGRMRVARWAVAPSPAYLRSAFPVSAEWLYPLCYVYRPARFVAGRLVRSAASALAVHA